jgi:hypothetical protein
MIRVRVLYDYALSRRIRSVLPDNPYADLVLALDDYGMRKCAEAAQSGGMKPLGEWAMRLILHARAEEASAILRQAAEAFPQHPLPRLLLGIAASSSGSADEAGRQIRLGMDLLAGEPARNTAAILLQECGIMVPARR